MAILQKNAYAKINLFLDIDSKREDGYHNIISVMQSISLCDTVTVEYNNCKDKIIDVTCDREGIPSGEKNIAYKAANAFLSSGHAKIHIKKRIPASAGLAGGSTDAAAVLILLNELTENKVSFEELVKIGASIGADVPFCMVGGTCLTLGIGENISPFTPIADAHIVIACHGEGVSTPKAYSSLDLIYNDFKNYTPHTKNLEALRASSTNFSQMFNIFESAILPVRPSVQKIKQIMTDLGADVSMMSGSGPSVFGIFSSKERAEKALNTLMSIGADAFLCSPQGTV